MRAARARRQGQSGWMTGAAGLMGTGMRDTVPILPAALGDQLPFDQARENVPAALIDPLARPRLAHIIADEWKARVRVNSDSLTVARMIGELTVGWQNDYPPTVDGMITAQNRLMSILRSLNLQPATLLATIRQIYRNCRNALGSGTVPVQSLEPYVVTLPGVPQVSRVFLEFVINGGHLISNAFLNHANIAELEPQASSRAIWGRLKVFAAEDPDIPDIDLDIIEDVQGVYVALDFPMMMGLYEAIVYSDTTPTQRRILGAAVVFVTAACKGPNETENYIARRITMLETEFPGVDVSTIFTLENVRAFCDMYVGQDVEVNTLYRSLMPLYSAFGGTKLRCLTWQIEQAIGTNCASIVAFAEAVIEQAYRPLGILLRKLSEAQWVQFMSMAYLVIRNPWGQIRAPRYPASAYKDITNYGRYARKHQNKAFKAYAGGLIAGGEITELEIKRIYEACKEQSDLLASEEMNLATEFRTLLPGLEIREADGAYYIHDGTDNPLNLEGRIRAMNLQQDIPLAPPRAPANAPGPLNDIFGGFVEPGADAGPAMDAQMRAEEREDRERREAALRMDWGQRFRGLPRSAVRLTANEVADAIIRRAESTPRYRAVKNILPQIRIAVSQEVLNPWTGPDDVTLRTRYRAAPLIVLQALEAFNINPNDIVPAVPGDDVAQHPEQYDEATMDTDAMWSRPRRDPVV